MSALPPSQMARISATHALEPIESLAVQWEAIHALAAQIAVMADITPERSSEIVAGFPALIASANQWQHELAMRGVEDIEVLLHHGLTALASVTARGQDPGAPALALWREFHHARETVLALLHPHAEAA